MSRKKYFQAFISHEDIYENLLQPKGLSSDLIPKNEIVTKWPNIQLKLQNKYIPDYSITLFAYRICSDKLRNIISKFDKNNSIQWLPFDVVTEDGGKLKYYELHFTQEFDVLDKDQSIYSKNGNVKVPKYSYKKIQNMHVFTYDSSKYALVISEEVKKTIQKAGCTNIIFSRVPVIYENELANYESN